METRDTQSQNVAQRSTHDSSLSLCSDKKMKNIAKHKPNLFAWGKYTLEILQLNQVGNYLSPRNSSSDKVNVNRAHNCQGIYLGANTRVC